MIDPNRTPEAAAEGTEVVVYEPPRLVRLGNLRADLLGHRTGHVKRVGVSDGVSLNRKN
jgi:hypothetical protein